MKKWQKLNLVRFYAENPGNPGEIRILVSTEKTKWRTCSVSNGSGIAKSVRIYKTPDLSIYLIDPEVVEKRLINTYHTPPCRA